MPLTEDFADFFDADELAHRAVLDSAVVSGIFDNGHRDALSMVGGGIAVQDPSFTLPSASCARTVVDTSRLRVEGEGSFLVTAIEPDGTGLTVLRLRKVLS